MATPRILSDELASRSGRKATKIGIQPPPAQVPALVPSGTVSDMVKLGPGAIGTSGAFQFTSPNVGTVRLRIRGTGSVVSVAFGEGNSSYSLNAGAVTTSGAFYEFEFAADGNESLFVTGTSLTECTCFWRPY